MSSAVLVRFCEVCNETVTQSDLDARDACVRAGRAFSESERAIRTARSGSRSVASVSPMVGNRSLRRHQRAESSWQRFEGGDGLSSLRGRRSLPRVSPCGAPGA